MLRQRDVSTTLSRLVLVAATVFLCLAVLSYDPHDPPASNVYPARDTISNLTGFAGAWIAHGLFTGLGLGAYVVAAVVIYVVTQLLREKPIADPVLKTAGWLLALIGGLTLTSMLLGDWTTGAPLGPGGMMGTLGKIWIESHFAATGAWIICLSFLAAGAVLIDDVRFLAVVRHVGLTLPARAALRAKSLVTRKREKPVYDVKDPDEEPRKAVPLPPLPPLVKRGKKRPPVEVDEDEPTDEPVVAEEPVETEIRPLQVNTPPPRGKRQSLIEELNAASRRTEGEPTDYVLPSIALLDEAEEMDYAVHEQDVRRKADILERTFANFGFEVRVVAVDTGPVIAQFEIELAPGLRLSRITGLADDIAIALRVPAVRIVAPIPGKNTVGIEIPNAERTLVRMREVIEESSKATKKMRLPLYVGKDVSGQPMVCDLATMPHLLIAGRTGTGKSVCLNGLICSLLLTRRPDEVKMLLIDPKQVEFHDFRELPHLLHPVVTDPEKAEPILAWAVEKMEQRYNLLARAGVRHIDGYNQLGLEEVVRRFERSSEDDESIDIDEIPESLPFIVIVIDEMADLMMTAPKEIESHIIRLAQKSRAVGIHLVLATQKPTVDVITGLIKSNLPARISFQVASRTDSRVVLDEMGADRLLGMGDFLFLSPATSQLLRGQATYISDDEIKRLVEAVGTVEPHFLEELLNLQPRGDDSAPVGELPRNRDELYEQAIEIVVNEGRGSVSLLQRALGIGYGRAARLIDFMEEDGIVDRYNGSRAREVLMSADQWNARRTSAARGAAPS
jgi:S-DNA-T family DNA segregation ATPase FtsK/SpoIIIE